MEKYDNCWFEIKSIEGRRIIRDSEKFTRTAEAMSLLHEITLYRIERSISGFTKSRIHVM